MNVRCSLALMCSLLLGVGVACGADDVDSRDLRIEIDRMAGRVFTASGPAVEDGAVCAGGSQFLVDFLDLDGTPLTLADFAQRREASIMADPPDVTTDHLQVMEFACADGTGAFTLVVEERNDGPWYVRDGTGAYRNLAGSGTLTVEREPSDHPEAPPGGIPGNDRLTGVVELVADG